MLLNPHPHLCKAFSRACRPSLEDWREPTLTKGCSKGTTSLAGFLKCEKDCAMRQPGSSIKPIMYSLALDKSYTAATIIDDSPITFHLPGGQTYKPVNYDGRFHGRVTLRLALANSFNIPAVKVLNTLGVDNFIRQAQRLGIRTWNDPSRFGLALTLGGGEVKMVDMATAYGVLANQGYRVNLSPLGRV